MNRPGRVDPAWILEQRTLGWPDMHPEDYCHLCGVRNLMWCVDSRTVWLEATATWAAETGREGICCLNCFTEMHEAATGGRVIWRLTQEAHMIPTEQYARELWEAAGGDDDTGISAAIFHRFNAEHGIHLTDPCGYCHGDDGAHEQFCPEAMCVTCNIPGCPGDCADRAWDAIRERNLDEYGEVWEGEGDGVFPEGEDA